MPITWRTGQGGRIDVAFSDPYSLPESEKVMKEIYARPDVGRPLRFLVDVRQSSPPDADFVLNAVTFWQAHVRDMWKAKVAVVAATDAQIDKAEFTERSAAWRDLPFTLRVFRDVPEAERWLNDEREGARG